MSTTAARTEELTAAEHTSAMTDYVREGLVLAERLGNRGSLRVDAHGRPHPDILDAYRE